MRKVLFAAATAGLSAVSALEQGNAQKAADSLTFFLAAPGEPPDIRIVQRLTL